MVVSTQTVETTKTWPLGTKWPWAKSLLFNLPKIFQKMDLRHKLADFPKSIPIHGRSVLDLCTRRAAPFRAGFGVGRVTRPEISN
jgi:hypothetical protein